ncbi:TIGR04211 family SH3 domain-containing protein [Aestuariibacter salexigens]|uniref:TIGR04211 family SH3 domain-containing protein n=1 Tax=Aestuariibacter salexigens TaxID=226010 RepID=UPI000479661D|nr:TIGR04211 family SH3 domain-containing protein [Aestuariibacter salexigens]
MIKTFLLIALSSLVFSSIAQENQEPNDQGGEVRYVTDNLYTFMHAGPGRNYRILGSVEAGTKVQQLQIDAEEGYVEIIDDRQRTGWVEAKFITSDPSIKEQVPQLIEALDLAQKELASSTQAYDRLNQQLSSEQNEIAELRRTLAELQKQNQTLREQVAESDQKELMQWALRGGLLALGSLVLGVLLTYLPKKKRRQDNWM